MFQVAASFHCFLIFGTSRLPSLAAPSWVTTEGRDLVIYFWCCVEFHLGFCGLRMFIYSSWDFRGELGEVFWEL